jgi:hypothetical protein
MAPTCGFVWRAQADAAVVPRVMSPDVLSMRSIEVQMRRRRRETKKKAGGSGTCRGREAGRLLASRSVERG